jgi:hypothetical protein
MSIRGWMYVWRYLSADTHTHLSISWQIRCLPVPCVSRHTHAPLSISWQIRCLPIPYVSRHIHTRLSISWHFRCLPVTNVSLHTYTPQHFVTDQISTHNNFDQYRPRCFLWCFCRSYNKLSKLAICQAHSLSTLTADGRAKSPPGEISGVADGVNWLPPPHTHTNTSPPNAQETSNHMGKAVLTRRCHTFLKKLK